MLRLAQYPLMGPRTVVIVYLCLGSLLIGCGDAKAKQQSTQQGRGNQTVPVTVALAERRDLPVYLTGLGSVDAFNTVTLKSRVDGQLMQVAFKEGQEVKKGDLLAVIDPRAFEVLLSQAQANLFKDQSALRDAQVNLERFQGLFKEGVISRQQLDTQNSQTGQMEGAVRADQAQIDSAKLQLSYTRIIAPVNGRAGLRLVDQGNMVHASDPNGLLVLTQLQPIAVLFTLPEDNLPNVAGRMRGSPLQVEAYSRDDQTKLATGSLQTIDNQIDATTGTGKLKAVFDNKDHSLWPNQFVNVRLLLEVRKDNVVVPAAAIQRGPQGTYVFVVKADKKAESRPVNVSFTQGSLVAIGSGVNAGETVVTDGQDKLQTGVSVEPHGVGVPDAADGAAPGARSGGRKGQKPGSKP